MFTGLITDVGTVDDVSERGSLRRVRIVSGYPADGFAIGASVACSGPCLTAVAIEQRGSGCLFEVDVGAETLERTTAAWWRQGSRLNLERSLRIGDEMGGHLVTGHVDAVVEVVARDAFDGMSRFSFRAPAELLRFVAAKGSVALDGTSLTVNGVTDDTFDVLLIPHTLAVTTWGERRVGDRLNLEVDLMARYAARLVDARAAK